MTFLEPIGLTNEDVDGLAKALARSNPVTVTRLKEPDETGLAVSVIRDGDITRGWLISDEEIADRIQDALAGGDGGVGGRDLLAPGLTTIDLNLLREDHLRGEHLFPQLSPECPVCNREVR